METTKKSDSFYTPVYVNGDNNSPADIGLIDLQNSVPTTIIDPLTQNACLSTSLTISNSINNNIVQSSLFSESKNKIKNPICSQESSFVAFFEKLADTSSIDLSSVSTALCHQVPSVQSISMSEFESHLGHSELMPKSLVKNNGTDSVIESTLLPTLGDSQPILGFSGKRKLSHEPRTCEKCGRTFKYPSDLKKHEQIHTQNKKFTCNQCGRSFRRLHQLNVHVRIHTGEKPYSCVQCGLSFRHDSTLTMHMRTLHQHLKPFKCDVCSKMFGRLSHLRKHQKYVCASRNPSHNGMEFDSLFVPYSTISCKKCGLVFAEQSQLAEHEATCSFDTEIQQLDGFKTIMNNEIFRFPQDNYSPTNCDTVSSARSLNHEESFLPNFPLLQNAHLTSHQTRFDGTTQLDSNIIQNFDDFPSFITAPDPLNDYRITNFFSNDDFLIDLEFNRKESIAESKTSLEFLDSTTSAKEIEDSAIEIEQIMKANSYVSNHFKKND